MNSSFLYRKSISFLNEMKKLKFNIIPNSKIKINNTLKNMYKGKRCFILGNGPSLNLYDLSFLKNEKVYCVNEFYRFSKFNDVSPDFYFLADPIYFNLKLENDEDYNFIESINQILEDDISLWLPYSAKKAVEQYKWDSHTNIFYFLNNLKWIRNNSVYCFDKCIPGMYAVIQYAILHAVYLGFDEIYMLGVEQTDIFSTLKSYIDETEEYNYAFKMDKDEKKWKRDQILKISVSTMLDGYSKIFYLYDELKFYCDKHKVKLYNCSPNSLIKSIPYYDYNSFLNK